ncbi:hypothetical protein J569_3501 [Acinetobacter sp. 907131]|nr:hypothetical protein J569_3501 [Acinetobacter sp. 907131]EXS18343.1 hypothetical protein J672_0019 [Acinetobacter sp. 883425]
MAFVLFIFKLFPKIYNTAYTKFISSISKNLSISNRLIYQVESKLPHQLFG